MLTPFLRFSPSRSAEDRLLLDPPADKVDSDNAAAAATAAPNFNPPSSINGDSALDAMSVDGDTSKSAPPINGRHAGGAPLPGDDGDSDLSGLSGDEDDDGASRAPPKSDADDGLSELADESRIESEMDDVSETASVSSRQPSARPMSSLAIRQQALKAQQQAKEAEAAARAQRIADHRAEVKAKTATSKQLSQERRRLEDEDARLAKREEALHRDFRKQINFPRARALGVDRFGNKVWWFDGTGAASLIGPGGVVLYGTGRLFLQGGDPQTRQFWGRKCDVPDDEILERRKAEEGEQGMLAEGEWVVYEDPAEVRRLQRSPPLRPARLTPSAPPAPAPRSPPSSSGSTRRATARPSSSTRSGAGGTTSTAAPRSAGP